MTQQLPAFGVWFSRLPSSLLILAVLGTLCAPAIVQLAGLSAPPILIDNRPAAPMPELPITIDRLDKFRGRFADFIEDNFGLRSEFVRLNIRLHALLGVSAVPGLVMGRDGWFFLKTDYAALDQYRGLNRFSERELDAWIDDMEIYRQWLERQGAAFMIVVAPNQQTIYPDQMPMYANRVWPETRLDQVSRRLRERHSKLSFLDLRPDFWAARTRELLFHKSENHWNPVGAFVAYTAIMEQIKKSFPDVDGLQLSDFDRSSHTWEWRVPPVTETEPVLTLKRRSRVIATEVLGMTGAQPVTKTTTDLDRAPDVLLYGDSFAHQGLLGPFNESFHSLVFLQTNHAPFPSELVKKQRPKLVIFQLVERYLARPLNLSSEFATDLWLQDAPSYRDVEKSAGMSGGVLDGVRRSGDRVEFSGWAIDKAANAPAQTIYAYWAERAVGVAKPSDPRPDVTSGMTDHRAGFRMSIPGNLDLRDASRQLRFFSVNPSGKIYEIAVNPPLLVQMEQMFKGLAKAQSMQQ